MIGVASAKNNNTTTGSLSAAGPVAGVVVSSEGKDIHRAGWGEGGATGGNDGQEVAVWSFSRCAGRPHEMSSDTVEVSHRDFLP